MTVQDLIEMLEECEPSWEVKMACQPSWPLQFYVANVVPADERSEVEGDDDDEDERDSEVVWLVQGDQPYSTPYAPSWVFNTF